MEQIKYAYYPGCSSETTGREYEASLRAVFAALNIDLKEMPGWTCCGASSGHSMDSRLSHALAGRNLAIAEAMGLDTAVACPACFQRLRTTLNEFQKDADLREELPRLMDMSYAAKYGVRHILEIISNSVPAETLNSKIVKPLSGLRPVAYYGCYLVRPPELTGFDDPENPIMMDNLLATLGADVPDWGGKVMCCGGSQSFTLRDSVIKMVSNIVAAAHEVEADALVTACPLCQANLETRQTGKDPIPVFYFTELMGIAMGLPYHNWLRYHLISPNRAMEKLQ